MPTILNLSKLGLLPCFKDRVMKRAIAIHILFISILSLFVTKQQAQDLQFSQFYSVPMFLSPSFAGSADGQRIVANYRNQWPEIPHAFETYAFSYDRYFSKMNSGVGIMLTQDRKGELGISTTGVDLIYAYDFRITPTIHARPGVQFQYSHEGINLNKMLTRTQIITGSPANDPVSRESIGYFDAGASLMFYNDVFWFGSTVNHLMKPNYTFGQKEKMPIRFSLYSGVKLLSKGKLLKPGNEHLFLALNYRQMVQFSQLDIGLLGHKNFFNLGLWYRGIPFIKQNPGSDALIFMIGFVQERYSVGLSYDMTISQLKAYTNGAVELSLTFLFPEPQPKKKHAMIPCPVF
jgi:type IX secretion system PorP/SprF family membrane protein